MHVTVRTNHGRHVLGKSGYFNLLQPNLKDHRNHRCHTAPMRLFFERGLVRSAYGANKVWYRNGLDLEIGQSFTQASGSPTESFAALTENVPVSSPRNDVCGHPDQSWCQQIWRIW